MQSRLGGGFVLCILLFSSACASTKPARNERAGLLDRGHAVSRERRSPTYFAKQENEGAVGSLPNSSAQPLAHISARRIAQLQNSTLDWKWPLRRSAVTSAFGRRGSDFHEGIDLRASAGTPVYAVGPGVVLYAGERVSGYGKMIVVRHRAGLATIYAHNSRLSVRPGTKVRGGQLLAYSGSSGHADGPHLHFEVRDGVTAIDPLQLLPGPARVTASLRPGTGTSPQIFSSR